MWSSTTTGQLPDAADAKDGTFGIIDDRRERIDAEFAQRRDGKRAALKIGGGGLRCRARATKSCDRLATLSDSAEDIANDGNQQPWIGIDGDSNVNSRGRDDAIVPQRQSSAVRSTCQRRQFDCPDIRLPTTCTRMGPTGGIGFGLRSFSPVSRGVASKGAFQDASCGPTSPITACINPTWAIAWCVTRRRGLTSSCRTH